MKARRTNNANAQEAKTGQVTSALDDACEIVRMCPEDLWVTVQLVPVVSDNSIVTFLQSIQQRSAE
jgi:hypothetical protein